MKKQILDQIIDVLTNSDFVDATELIDSIVQIQELSFGERKKVEQAIEEWNSMYRLDVQLKYGKNPQEAEGDIRSFVLHKFSFLD